MLEAHAHVVDAAPRALRSGATLNRGRFEIRRELGTGGRAIVYEALDRVHDRSVAIKVPHSRGAQTSLDLHREYGALTSVSHPNVVCAGEFVAECATCFFTMKCIDGCELGEWTSAARPDPERTQLCRALSDLACGVQAIHGAGLVHCDLKPSNVLVSPAGRVTILDLGLATVRGRAVQPHVRISGTPAYVAPEFVRRARVEAATDVYAIGVMLYEGLTGRLPFEGRPYEILFQKQWFNAPPPRTICPQVPLHLNRLCMELLARDPLRRPGLDDVIALAERVTRPEAAGRGDNFSDTEGNWNTAN